MRFLNVSSVTFTPTVGDPVVIPGVTLLVVNPRSSVARFAGDADLFPTGKRVVMVDPKVTLDAKDSATMDGVDVGAEGVLTWIANAGSGGSATGGGAKQWTASAAIYAGSDRTAKYRNQATSVLSFETRSVDGQTNPVSSQLV